MATHDNYILFFQAEWYKKTVAEKRGLVVNDFFVVKLKAAINFSFSNLPKMDAQFIITLDLRFTNRKRNCLNIICNDFATH